MSREAFKKFDWEVAEAEAKAKQPAATPKPERDYFVPLTALAGLLLIAGSFAWPHFASRGPVGWTNDKALRHAQTQADLHAATDAAGHGSAPAASARVRELQERLNLELEELDAARNRGALGQRLLWWLGAACVAVAVWAHYRQRNASTE